MRIHAWLTILVVCLPLVGAAHGQFSEIEPIVQLNDPLFPSSTLAPHGQHWLHTTNVTYAWTLVGYNDPWAVDHSNVNRTIAIIDTGIDMHHPDFDGGGPLSKIHPASATIVEGAEDAFPGLCPCTPSFYDPPDPENGPTDVEDVLWHQSAGGLPHGTISAGIAGAYAQNNEGIAGVCWDCSVLVLRVATFFNEPGSPCEGCIASAVSLAAAIRYAAGWTPNQIEPQDPLDPSTWSPVRARVISIATTGIPGYASAADFCDPTNPLNIAIDQAHARGCVIVTIAGNRNEACWSDDYPNEPTCTPVENFPDHTTNLPLAWHPKTIAVGGTCRTGNNWNCRSRINPPIGDLGSCGDSSYPLRPIDNTAPVLSVVAPIEDMVSTFAYDDEPDPPIGALYGFIDAFGAGTSWAAPQVAGVVALMLGVNDELTPDQVKYILEITATDIEDTGYDRHTGFGLLNARKAVEYVIKQTLPADWNGDGSVGPIDPVLYMADFNAGDPMTDLDLDEVSTTEDVTIFLNSYNGN